MKLARYVGGGRVEIRDEPEPSLPPGGLLVRSEASGLCSGELMDWYMERKVPHVLGHEVAGKVLASEDDRFPIGSKVAPHHHAACGQCDFCRRGRHVHCAVWKRSKLVPGGMAEIFAVSAENLVDTHRVDDIRPQDAALMEPLGCVAKSLSNLTSGGSVGVIGVGAMGLMHLLALGGRATGIERSGRRRAWANGIGLRVIEAGESKFDCVVVCPGTPEAISTAFRLVAPGGQIILFAPLAPEEEAKVPWDRLYFEEIALIPSYSCGPSETAQALTWLREGVVKAEQVVSHFVGMDDLPEAYLAMKKGEILKAMVMFE